VVDSISHKRRSNTQESRGKKAQHSEFLYRESKGRVVARGDHRYRYLQTTIEESTLEEQKTGETPQYSGNS